MSDDLNLRPPPPRTLEEEEARLLRELGGLESMPRAGALTLPRRVRLSVASPCPERWASMPGDDRVRRCTRCDRQVMDLGGLSADEIESLCTAREITLGARVFRRSDGAVTTSDCEVGRPRRLAMRALAILAVCVVASTAVAYALRPSEDVPVVTR